MYSILMIKSNQDIYIYIYIYIKPGIIHIYFLNINSQNSNIPK